MGLATQYMFLLMDFKWFICDVWYGYLHILHCSIETNIFSLKFCLNKTHLKTNVYDYDDQEMFKGVGVAGGLTESIANFL